MEDVSLAGVGTRDQRFHLVFKAPHFKDDRCACNAYFDSQDLPVFALESRVKECRVEADSTGYIAFCTSGAKDTEQRACLLV